MHGSISFMSLGTCDEYMQLSAHPGLCDKAVDDMLLLRPEHVRPEHVLCH